MGSQRQQIKKGKVKYLIQMNNTNVKYKLINYKYEQHIRLGGKDIAKN